MSEKCTSSFSFLSVGVTVRTTPLEVTSGTLMSVSTDLSSIGYYGSGCYEGQ